MPEKERIPQFQWNPEDYRNSSPAQKQWAEELIAKLALTGNEQVLDIGCGDGRVTAGIAGNLPEGAVVGIDSSPDMIRFAGEHFPRTRYPNLSFLMAPAESLVFRDAFDLVFSNAALHWVADHRPVLDGIGRALRPGGRMLVQMGGRGNAAQIFIVLDDMIRNRRWQPYFEDFSFRFGFFDDTTYTALVQEAGLTPVRVELIRKDMAYPSREGFAAWIRTTWLPWLVRVPEPEQPAFIDALVDAYCSRYPPDSGGVIHVGMVRLEAEALKK
jgi:trans-aconitate 2-methyltransferase